MLLYARSMLPWLQRRKPAGVLARSADLKKFAEVGRPPTPQLYEAHLTGAW